MSEGFPTVLERVTTGYNQVVVQRVGRRIDLSVAGATFATWHPEHLLTGYSWDAITAGCFLHPGASPSSVLLLGLAGGTVARQLRYLLPGVDLDAVEIDPELVELGRRYMDLDRFAVRVHIGDAYRYLSRTSQRFDVIADDIYLTGLDDVERPRAPTDRMLETMKRSLKPGGVLLANFVTGDHHDRLYRDAVDCFRRAFTQVRIVAPPRGYNRILVGGQVLGTPRSVTQVTACFRRKRDRELWSRLAVRAPRSRGAAE